MSSPSPSLPSNTPNPSTFLTPLPPPPADEQLLDWPDGEPLLAAKLQSIASFYNELLQHTLTQQYDYFTHAIDTSQRLHAENVDRAVAHYRALGNQVQAEQQRLSTLEQERRTVEKQLRDIANRIEALRKESEVLTEANMNLLTTDKNRSVQIDPNATQSNTSDTQSVAPSSSSSSSPPSTSISDTSSTTTSASSSTSAVSIATSSSTSSSSSHHLTPFQIALSQKDKHISALQKEVAELMQQMEKRANRGMK